MGGVAGGVRIWGKMGGRGTSCLSALLTLDMRVCGSRWQRNSLDMRGKLYTHYGVFSQYHSNVFEDETYE